MSADSMCLVVRSKGTKHNHTHTHTHTHMRFHAVPGCTTLSLRVKGYSFFFMMQQTTCRTSVARHFESCLNHPQTALDPRRDSFGQGSTSIHRPFPKPSNLISHAHDPMEVCVRGAVGFGDPQRNFGVPGPFNRSF